MKKNFYFIRNKKALFCFRVLDGILDFYEGAKKSIKRKVNGLFRKDGASLDRPEDKPKKILLSNIAHLGDVVIATAVLPALKRAFPKCKIGFVVSSSSRCVIEKHPFVDRIHIVDHWKIDRSQKPLWKKFLRYRKTRKKALFEIKEEKYDVAIDLYLYFPNTIPLFWRGKIPVRIGYTTGGFGPLLTHPVEWQDKKQYMSFYYEELLAKLSVAIQEPLVPYLPRNKRVHEILERKLPEKFLQKGYIVVHPSNDSEHKEWPIEKWQQLLAKDQESRFFVFTGKGKKEKETIQKICENFFCECFVDLSDQISWEEFVCVIQKAKLVIALDTCITHIARSFSIPNLILFTGLDEPSKWAPPESFLFFHQKQGISCCKNEGCVNMGCIRDVSVCDVYKKMTEILT